MAKTRRAPRTAKDRALDEIYKEIPSIPGCTGKCADACGPIAMFAAEWDRIKRTKGHTPRMHPARPLTCPMLSPTGRCTVYTVRPYICRLWGTTPALKCPEGCEPERWLSAAEAHEILGRLRQLTGGSTAGPLGNVTDLKEAIGLTAREERLALLQRIEEAARNGAKFTR